MTVISMGLSELPTPRPTTMFDIGTRSGYYTEYDYDGDTTVVLVVPCEDATYSLSGELSKDEITNVGQSLDCK